MIRGVPLEQLDPLVTAGLGVEEHDERAAVGDRQRLHHEYSAQGSSGTLCTPPCGETTYTRTLPLSEQR